MVDESAAYESRMRNVAQIAIITWENGFVPEGMEISVKFSLAGGYPEPFYAQVRMAAVIDSIGTM